MEMNERISYSTCQRINTDVVVCGVTDKMVGASSGAEEKKKYKSNTQALL